MAWCETAALSFTVGNRRSPGEDDPYAGHLERRGGARDIPPPTLHHVLLFSGYTALNRFKPLSIHGSDRKCHLPFRLVLVWATGWVGLLGGSNSWLSGAASARSTDICTQPRSARTAIALVKA